MPERGDVERFIKDTLSKRAVADKADDDAVRTTDALGQRQTGRDGNDPSLYTVAEEPVEVEMLRAAEATADAGSVTADFRVERAGVAARCEEVAVAPVVREDAIAWTKMSECRHSYRLLPDIGVRRAVELLLAEKAEQFLLETTYLQHGRIMFRDAAPRSRS